MQKLTRIQSTIIYVVWSNWSTSTKGRELGWCIIIEKLHPQNSYMNRALMHAPHHTTLTESP